MQTLYVNTDDQSSGEYATLALAEAALPSFSDDHTIECVGVDDDSSSVIINPTINAYSLTIKGNQTSGVVDDSKYKLRTNASYTVQPYCDVTFEDIQINSYATGVSDEVIRVKAATTITIKRSLLWFDSLNGDQQDIIYNDSKVIIVNMENCVCWNVSRCVIDFYFGEGSSVNIDSCTFYNIDNNSNYRHGIVGSNSGTGGHAAIIRNTLAHLASSDYGFCYRIQDATVENSIINSTNLTSETTVTSQLNNITSATFTDDDSKTSDGDWVILKDLTTAPYDFGLAANDYNEAIEAGQDLSGTFTDDITGATRSTPWDIGAFILVSGVSGTAVNVYFDLQGLVANALSSGFDTAAQTGNVLAAQGYDSEVLTSNARAKSADTSVSTSSILSGQADSSISVRNVLLAQSDSSVLVSNSMSEVVDTAVSVSRAVIALSDSLATIANIFAQGFDTSVNVSNETNNFVSENFDLMVRVTNTLSQGFDSAARVGNTTSNSFDSSTSVSNSVSTHADMAAVVSNILGRLFDTATSVSGVTVTTISVDTAVHVINQITEAFDTSVAISDMSGAVTLSEASVIAVADAVWGRILESGLSAEEIIKIMAASLAGKASGAGTGTMTFKGLDGSTDRIISTVDGTGNRTAVTVDGA